MNVNGAKNPSATNNSSDVNERNCIKNTDIWPWQVFSFQLPVMIFEKVGGFSTPFSLPFFI